MKLYSELAQWWPLLSSPQDYGEEAAFFHGLIAAGSSTVPKTLLELGSGGGNNALHLKAHYAATLVDISPEMLAVSRALNPGCEHLEGDMRSVRLGRAFDAVFIHDAVDYMLTENDLRAAMVTAFEHLRLGGVALFVPDYVRETFAPSTDWGGHDADGLGARYLEWTFDTDPSDTTYQVEFAVLVRDASGDVRSYHDRQTAGLFARAVWFRLLRGIGFEVETAIDRWKREIFIAKRPPAS